MRAKLLEIIYYKYNILIRMRYQVLTNIDELDSNAESWEGLGQICHTPISSSFDVVKVWLSVFKELLAARASIASLSAGRLDLLDGYF